MSQENNDMTPRRSFSYEELKDIWRILIRESDRGCVLVGAAILDECLENLLRAKFESDPKLIRIYIDPLFDSKRMAPLSSFYAKTRLCLALGLIRLEICQALDHIRDLRNEFAHQKGPAELDDPIVSNILKELTEETRRYAKALAEVCCDCIKEMEQAGEEINKTVSGLTTMRLEFLVALSTILTEIEDAKERRLECGAPLLT